MKCANCGGIFLDGQRDGGAYQHRCPDQRVTSDHGDDLVNGKPNPKRTVATITERRQTLLERRGPERRRGDRRQRAAPLPGGVNRRTVADRRGDKPRRTQFRRVETRGPHD